MIFYIITCLDFGVTFVTVTFWYTCVFPFTKGIQDPPLLKGARSNPDKERHIVQTGMSWIVYRKQTKLKGSNVCLTFCFLG